MSSRKKIAKTVESEVADHLAETITQGPSPSALSKRIDGWRDTLSEQINEHPVRTVAVALGTGYLLAGGLFSRLTARLVGLGVRIGLRVGGAPLVTRSVVALREGLLSRTDAVRSQRADRSRASSSRMTLDVKENAMNKDQIRGKIMRSATARRP